MIATAIVTATATATARSTAFPCFSPPLLLLRAPATATENPTVASVAALCCHPRSGCGCGCRGGESPDLEFSLRDYYYYCGSSPSPASPYSCLHA